MKFDYFGFSITALSWYFSALSLMINGRDETGKSRPGIMRHLIFVGHDPIGWRLQLLWFIIPTGYDQKYYLYMLDRQERMKYPHGRPAKTGGVHQKSYKPKNNDHKLTDREWGSDHGDAATVAGICHSEPKPAGD